MEKIITIDGPAASGKTTLCKLLSQKWRGWSWLSTGVFYRGLAYLIIDLKLNTEDEWVQCIQQNSPKKSLWKVEQSPEHTLFLYKGKDLTSALYNTEIDNKASDVAKSKAVRTALIPYQRAQIKEGQGLIAEGRDCGTAIFPSAGLKIYLTAQDDVRTQRRITERGEDSNVIVSALNKRDKQDLERATNPLKKPEDALVIHTDQCSLSQIEEIVFKKAQDLWGPISLNSHS